MVCTLSPAIYTFPGENLETPLLPRSQGTAKILRRTMGFKAMEILFWSCLKPSHAQKVRASAWHVYVHNKRDSYRCISGKAPTTPQFHTSSRQLLFALQFDREIWRLTAAISRKKRPLSLA